MSTPAVSRFPVPKLAELPEDIRSRIDTVQEKAGFVPNVFIVLAHRPDEFRAFFAYHDALMLREGRPHEGGEGDDRGGDLERQPVPVLHRRPRRDPARVLEAAAARGPGGGQLPEGGHLARASARSSTSR